MHERYGMFRNICFFEDLVDFALVQLDIPPNLHTILFRNLNNMSSVVYSKPGLVLARGLNLHMQESSLMLDVLAMTGHQGTTVFYY